MKDDRLLEDRDLADAFRSVRDAYDGTNADSNLTLQRALFRTRTQERRQRLTRWVVLPIAAVLVASTAWAGVTGKLAPAMHSLLESFHAEHAPPPTGAPVVVAPTASALAANEAPPEPAPSASAVDAPADPVPVEAPPVVAPTPAPAVVSAPPGSNRTATPFPQAARAAAGTTTAAVGATIASAPAVDPPASKEPAAPAPSASAPDPHAALFAEAHRLHFTERDPARALAAWDRYLAVAPNGRFAPEARYNRALTLVRLGRPSEAKTELDAFANGMYGSYRRDEAKALLEALSRDASRP